MNADTEQRIKLAEMSSFYAEMQRMYMRYGDWERAQRMKWAWQSVEKARLEMQLELLRRSKP